VDLVWCELPTADPRPAEKFAKAMKKHAPHIKLGFHASPNFKVDHWNGAMHASAPARVSSYVSMGFDLMFHTTVSAKSAMFSWHNVLAELATNDFGGVSNPLEKLRAHPPHTVQ